MTDKVIPVPPECHKKVSTLVEAVQRAQYMLDMYINGIRDALCVPQDWVLDIQKMEFRPRDSKGQNT